MFFPFQTFQNILRKAKFLFRIPISSKTHVGMSLKGKAKYKKSTIQETSFCARPNSLIILSGKLYEIKRQNGAIVEFSNKKRRTYLWDNV